MTNKILISADVCDDEVVRYLAARYKCSPRDIICRFLEQDRLLKDSEKCETNRSFFEENEMEILRDMNIRPTEIDFV